MSFKPLLPAELWKEIFMACLPNDIDGYIAASPYEAPLLLCQICRCWREIAISTPELWESLEIMRNGSKCTPKADLVDLWISRSANRPLSIMFGPAMDTTLYMKSDEIKPILQILIRCLPRWADMYLCLADFSEDNIDIDSVPEEGPSMLEAIILYMPIDAEDTGPIDIHIFGNLSPAVSLIFKKADVLEYFSLHCPRLTFRSAFWMDAFQLPRNNLTALRLLNALNVDDCIRTLQESPNVEDALFTISAPGSGLMPHLTTNILHTLCLYMAAPEGGATIFTLLDGITTPSLCNLAISFELSWSTVSFTSFLERSSCSIRNLHLEYPDMTTGEITDCLSAVSPALQRLRISGSIDNHPNHPPKIITPELLQLLTPQTEAAGVLCPHLVEIHLDAFSLTDEDGPFANMVNARLSGNNFPSFSRLEAVSLRVALATHSRDVQRLTAMGEEDPSFSFELIPTEADWLAVGTLW
ncbi:hypothetical protein BDQ12DRAFT_79362 [Crucibulum laeve]|uniref:F-box domain-containing protein n=1 Tax=Crucibulum laeve TaxID=68775 RepID=A0A5C3LFF0_9AGAR|nr:hypothetical protein BDQ12DRAFT_79362 [Crucibulum laeve]